MLGQQFYHETIRKVIIAFGTVFNSINLVRKDNSGTITQTHSNNEGAISLWAKGEVSYTVA